MRIYKEEEKQYKVQVLINITCDRCKKDIAIVHGDCMAGVSLTIDAGYGSGFDFAFSNSGCETFDICDNCAYKILTDLGWKDKETL